MKLGNVVVRRMPLETANMAPAVLLTCLAGEVKLNGFDTNVGGAGGHDCSNTKWCESNRRVVLAKEGVFTPLV
jgi:hypothetical protein